MAQRSLPLVPSRIFIRKPSLASRILSGSLLAPSLLVTLAGLGTAIYLERARDLAAAAPPAPVAALRTETPDQAAAPLPGAAVLTRATREPPAPVDAAPAVPAVAESPAVVSPPVPAPPPAESPVAGSSAPMAPAMARQVAALEAPPPAAAAALPAAATGHYWVEYGVFVGERYARRLQQALADHGLAATVVASHAPDGRPLLRVRSAAMADYAGARAAAASAEQALGIGTLVHRSAGESPAPTPAPVIASSGDQRYWVQFGAFPRPQQAERVKDVLQQSGIDTIVSTMRATSGRLFFLVRSVRLPDRDSALALAHRGRQAANVDVLVGRSLEQRHGAAGAPSTVALPPVRPSTSSG
jgi:cell division septation protein DedD